MGAKTNKVHIHSNTERILLCKKPRHMKLGTHLFGRFHRRFIRRSHRWFRCSGRISCRFHCWILNEKRRVVKGSFIMVVCVVQG